MRRKPDISIDAEMKLLRELAGDIAFAIDHIDKRERLDYLAYYDPLTGLPNRTLFYDTLRRPWSRRRKAAGWSPCCASTWITSRM